MTSLKLQQVFTLASVTSCVNIREFLKDTTTADNHEKVAWKREFTFFSVSIVIIPTHLLCQGKRTLLELNFYQHIQVHKENEFCHCLFTSFKKHESRHFHEYSRAIDGKEICKKVCAKLLFCLVKLLPI